jgi:hypothetical protein
MKTTPLIGALVVVLALGGWLFAERQNARDLQRQLALAREESQRQADASRSEVEVIAQLEARKGEKPDAGNSGDTAAAPEAKKETAANALGGFGKMISKFLTDPKMREAMRPQQMMGVKMLYGDLAKELGLAPDKANQVMEILADRQMAMTSRGVAALGDDATSGTLEDAAADVTDTRDEFDEQLKGLLGEDGFAKLSEYERTAGERFALNQYKQSFSASGLPLNDAQSDQLLSIMKQERLNQPPSPFDPGGRDIGGALKAIQSDEAINAAMSNQEAMNRRVLSRSREVLTPDQMAQFEQIQKQQLDMVKMGAQMGRAFLKGAGGEK